MSESKQKIWKSANWYEKIHFGGKLLRNDSLWAFTKTSDHAPSSCQILYQNRAVKRSLTLSEQFKYCDNLSYRKQPSLWYNLNQHFTIVNICCDHYAKELSVAWRNIFMHLHCRRLKPTFKIQNQIKEIQYVETSVVWTKYVHTEQCTM